MAGPHNPKITGSNPVPATKDLVKERITKYIQKPSEKSGGFFWMGTGTSPLKRKGKEMKFLRVVLLSLSLFIGVNSLGAEADTCIRKIGLPDLSAITISSGFMPGTKINFRDGFLWGIYDVNDSGLWVAEGDKKKYKWRSFKMFELYCLSGGGCSNWDIFFSKGFLSQKERRAYQFEKLLIDKYRKHVLVRKVNDTVIFGGAPSVSGDIPAGRSPFSRNCFSRITLRLYGPLFLG